MVISPFNPLSNDTVLSKTKNIHRAHAFLPPDAVTYLNHTYAQGTITSTAMGSAAHNTSKLSPGFSSAGQTSPQSSVGPQWELQHQHRVPPCFHACSLQPTQRAAGRTGNHIGFYRFPLRYLWRCLPSARGARGAQDTCRGPLSARGRALCFLWSPRLSMSSSSAGFTLFP